MNNMYGVAKLKHVLSLLISFLLLVTSLSAGIIAVAKTVPHETSLDHFASELTKLVRNYDRGNSNISDEYINSDNTAESAGLSSKYPITYTEMPDESEIKDSAEQIMNVQYAGQNISGAPYDLPSNAFVSKRLIVKSEKDIDYQGAIDVVSGYNDLYILQYESINAARAAYEYYLNLTDIEYVEPDYILEMQGEITDEIKYESSDCFEDDEENYKKGAASEYYYEIVDKVSSWNSEEIGFEDIKDELAQKYLEDVTVAVLDSGVDTDHEIFEGRLLENDVNLSGTGEENSCEDDFGHGTHVAGIIVDNTLSNVKIKPYKVLNNKGEGPISLIAVAVDMAVADGADIVNMSISSEGESRTMTDSVNEATDAGVNVVVAAGNDKADLSKEYYSPACIESAITVSATNKKDTLSSYSNYNGTIDIAAPGDSIKSSYLNNTYVLLDGTSMAAPQVSAGIAIIRSVYPQLTSAEVEEMLEKYAIKMEEKDETTNYYGAGLLYLKYILQSLPRTAEPVFSVEEGLFSNSFTLRLSCPEKGATILYVIRDIEDDDKDFSIGYLNGEKYSTSITVSVDTKISAIAVVRGKMFSSIVTKEYIRTSGSEEDFYDIDSAGNITGYVGTEGDLVIPEAVQGKTVKGIGASAFKDNTKITSVVLPDTVTKIGNYAFSGCTNLESVAGNGITRVETSSFQNSTIENFPFEQLKYVGSYAFSGCNKLHNVKLTSATTIGSYAFENAREITELNSASITTMGTAAFRGTNLESIFLPNVTSLPANVFEKCSSLKSASIPNLENVGASSFRNCISLSSVDVPLITTVGTNAFQNVPFETVCFENLVNAGNYAFGGNTVLTKVILPDAESIGACCFEYCSNLQIVVVPKLTALNNSIFNGCEKLKSLWVPSVKTVAKNAFSGSSIEYVQFDVAENVASLPDTLIGVVFPSSLVTVTGDTPKSDYTVYGYAGTYAEQYASYKDKAFSTVPAISCDMPESVNPEEEYIVAYALGFACTYQWYKNDTLSNENGTPIEDAVNFWYKPTRADNAVCYYCIIESNDGINRSKVVTSPIENAPEYREADYTAYDALIEDVGLIDRELYTDESLSVLDELLAQDISGYSLAEQDLITVQMEAIKNAISSLAFDYTLGDINDDDKISLLDVRLALKAVSGTEELDKLQNLSADMNEDGKISLIDVRAILRIISGVFETEE